MQGWAATDVEAARARYRPQQIATLFVGESPPASGAFFYYGNNAITRHMQRAVEAALGSGSGGFLTDFKARGWYLDDLVLHPVNQLRGAQRRAAWRDAQAGLAARIAEYHPRAIVTCLLSIAPVVQAAAVSAGSSAPRFAVPFPGCGQQGALPPRDGAHSPFASRQRSLGPGQRQTRIDARQSTRGAGTMRPSEAFSSPLVHGSGPPQRGAFF